MAALCKAPTKSAGIGLSITAVCKNAGKKTLGQAFFHKGMERPVPALLKALGQVFLIPLSE